MHNVARIDDHTDFTFAGAVEPAGADVHDSLMVAEEARSDERAARLEAEATAGRLAELIAVQHRQIADERAAREKAEIEADRAQRTAREMANLVAKHQARVEQAEDRARQAFCAYLDDPFRAPQAPRPSRLERMRARLRRDEQ
jgi:hypothetical protein